LEQMKKRIWLAVLLGIIIGVTLGYTPYVSPTAAPRTQFLMQQAGEPNIAQASPQHQSDTLSIFIALAAGLLIAIPAFVVAKRRNN